MEPEIETMWNLAKESRPDAVVFVRTDDVYFLRGADVDTIKEQFGLRCFGTTIGLDTEEAWYYMHQLADRGHAVLRVERGGVAVVSPNGRRPEIRRPRGDFLALDPRALFDASAMARVKEHETLYTTIRDLVARDDQRGLREYGELYVFEVDGWYEIDWELSTILPSRALLIARIAKDIGEKIPCRLVLPKAWRGKRKGKRDRQPPQQPKNFGQMRLEL
jgi:hypothetical protein